MRLFCSFILAFLLFASNVFAIESQNNEPEKQKKRKCISILQRISFVTTQKAQLRDKVVALGTAEFVVVLEVVQNVVMAS